MVKSCRRWKNIYYSHNNERLSEDTIIYYGAVVFTISYCESVIGLASSFFFYFRNYPLTGKIRLHVVIINAVGRGLTASAATGMHVHVRRRTAITRNLWRCKIFGQMNEAKENPMDESAILKVDIIWIFGAPLLVLSTPCLTSTEYGSLRIKY